MSGIAQFARAAFAAGYAEAGSDALPVTGAAVAELKTALAFAEENVDHPGILEVVRRIGRDRAMLVAVDRRRDALEARWRRKLRPLLRRFAPVVGPSVVNAVTKTVRPHAKDHMEALSQEDAAAAITAAERALEAFTDDAIYREWMVLTRDAWREGQAEGTAEGRAWMAQARGMVIPDYDIQFRHAMLALRDMPQEWSDLDTWMGRQTHGLAYEMGPRLAQGIEDGLDREALLSMVADIMGEDGNGAELMLDHAIATGVSDGALMLYTSEGLDRVDVLVSADACEECEPLQDEGPYPVDDAPDVPIHPRCRCCITPHLGLL